mgnify:CR=1 FL=1
MKSACRRSLVGCVINPGQKTIDDTNVLMQNLAAEGEALLALEQDAAVLV